MKIREGEAASAMGENPISVADAERRDGILAKAKEILARQPTPAEIEEDEARRKRLTVPSAAMPDLAALQKEWLSGSHMSDERFYEMRRLEALAKIAPPPPKPAAIARKAPIDRKSTITLLECARKNELELKVKAGGKFTDQERAEWWLLHSMEIRNKVDRLVRRNRVSDAIFLIVKELAIVSVSQSRNREKLEARIAAFEAGTIKGERTVVVKHDEKGRILETIKVPFWEPLTEKPRVRVKAIQEIIA